MNLKPSVKSQIRDPKTGVVYSVMAYRKLTQAELIHAVQEHSRRAKKKPRNGSEVIIVSVIGFDGG